MDKKNEMDDLDDMKDMEGNGANVMKHSHDSKNTRIRTKLRLGEVERLIRKHRIVVPPPSRTTLIEMCEDGTFETPGTSPTRIGWLVYEDSFWRWAADL
ncbi:MAG: hypothetical protein KF762_03675 [Acidobacteria bacterium]|nr:hypothetical protein [Acidobacteriota bacterium]